MMSKEMIERANEVLSGEVISPVTLTREMSREERRAVFLKAIGRPEAVIENKEPASNKG